jgi:hypothetical protein
MGCPKVELTASNMAAMMVSMMAALLVSEMVG